MVVATAVVPVPAGCQLDQLSAIRYAQRLYAVQAAFSVCLQLHGSRG